MFAIHVVKMLQRLYLPICSLYFVKQLQEKICPTSTVENLCNEFIKVTLSEDVEHSFKTKTCVNTCVLSLEAEESHLLTSS